MKKEQRSSATLSATATIMTMTLAILLGKMMTMTINGEIVL